MKAGFGHRLSAIVGLAFLSILVLLLSGCSNPTANVSVEPTATPAVRLAARQPPISPEMAHSPVPSPTATIQPTATAAPQPTNTPRPTETPAPRTVIYAPILMYHNFDNAHNIYSVRPGVFRSQLQALKKAGFHDVTMKQIVAALDNGAPLPDHPLVITMDDARATQKTAIEILKQEGFTATLFVPSGWHELSKEYIVQLDHEGFDIESHTVWHANVARNPGKIAEIREGQKTLEEWLGHPVLGFAYPYGAYRPIDIAELKHDGFKYAVSMRYGVALRRDERYRWPRILVTNESPDHLISLLNNLLKHAEDGKEPPAPAQWG